MSDLTERQTEILAFVRDWIGRKSYAPTRDEIREHFGFASINAVRDHLQALQRKGWIEQAEGSHRSIRLVRDSLPSPADQYQLPLVGQIAAGTPITAAENIDTWLKIDPALFHPRADFLHQVVGHSMKEANIFDGDIVGIHAQDDADSGQIIAAVLINQAGDDEITLKRYLRRGNIVILRPENSAPAYRSIEIDLSQLEAESQERMPFRIAGVFSGLIRVPR